MLLLVMAYRLLREFRQASTRLDTPPFSNRHHLVSAIALVTACSQACYAFAPLAFGALRDLGANSAVSSDGTRLFIAAALVQFAAAGLVLLNRQRATRPAVIEV